ncbi:isoprenyl transferase [Corynebacterium diphtheriae]|nr:isoprenyl transferase [Corynebacterium diphtheriae]CAB0707034.1 isoprenyl transferase [Corynebacterium diphtheriae]CAB0707783.1 isoprenyl transferase [Corynebacterium diphtheriae]CAB0729941.1 isoprenyl transferase [Corynebacterium diphtheriae]CAB0756861.1 isoprenyl transferase [Corynebacterium diphtheriae]
MCLTKCDSGRIVGVTKQLVPPKIPQEFLPRHIALVMDGNGRWATNRGLKRTEGHKRGEAVLLDMVDACIAMGIPYLSAYAFSTENWRRSTDEVRFLMGFNRDVLRRQRDALNAKGVRVRWVGRRPRLWRSVIRELEAAEELTKDNTTMTLAMCVNYGGRAEIVDAVREIARRSAAGTLRPEDITEDSFTQFLDEPDMPDVDLFLRPSGEKRTSNFLLWQSAYAEMVYQNKLFPDYTPEDLFAAVEEYARRDRRFGGTK